MAPERALLVGLSVIVCRFAQPLGKFLWVRVQHKAPVEIPLGGCDGSAKDRVTPVTRIVPFSVLTTTTVLARQRANFYSANQFNYSTEDAANLATTLHASPDATKAVLENMNLRGRGEEASSPSHCGPV